MKFRLILPVLLLLCDTLLSQSILPDTSAPEGYKNAVALYNTSIREELHLFNGRESNDYNHPFVQGTPYFITANWSKGRVEMEGKVYDTVSLLYDVVKDQLFFLYFNNISGVQLDKEKVAGFSIMGH